MAGGSCIVSCQREKMNGGVVGKGILVISIQELVKVLKSLTSPNLLAFGKL